MSLHCRFCRIFGKFTDEHNGPMDFKVSNSPPLWRWVVHTSHMPSHFSSLALRWCQRNKLVFLLCGSKIPLRHFRSCYVDIKRVLSLVAYRKAPEQNKTITMSGWKTSSSLKKSCLNERYSNWRYVYRGVCSFKSHTETFFRRELFAFLKDSLWTPTMCPSFVWCINENLWSPKKGLNM